MESDEIFFSKADLEYICAESGAYSSEQLVKKLLELQEEDKEDA